MDGLLSSAAAVEEALRSRLAFYGQLEHTRLLQLERQLDLLDGAAAAQVAALQAARTRPPTRRRAWPSRELAAVRGAAREREREIEMLRFQVGEIEAAEVEPGEDVRLGLERERLRHAGKLLERAGGALTLLAGETESGGARLACASLSASSARRRRSTRRSRASPSASTASPPSSTTCRRRCAPISTTSTWTRPTATPSSCATTGSRG